MSLSNTATPRYYGEFRDKVLRGEIPVNREINDEMNRIDELIRNPNIWYDDQAVEGFIRYCENELMVVILISLIHSRCGPSRSLDGITSLSEVSTLLVKLERRVGSSGRRSRSV